MPPFQLTQPPGASPNRRRPPLALAAYQGYVQYFVAFADSTLTHQVYNESTVAVARAIHQSPSAVAVLGTSTQSTLDYLNYPQSITLVQPATIKQENDKAALYLISVDDKDQMIGFSKR